MNKTEVLVLDTVKPVEGIHAHIVKDASLLGEGKEYSLEVDLSFRENTKKNHTATHLLQSALINVLGEHVKQAGSSVSDDRLRFDFTHPEKLTDDSIREVELQVNNQIRKSTSVSADLMGKDEALKKGALALFGEKYDSEVRVISVEGYSTELCGGTHVKNTSEIGVFKIISESSLASGVRRIEACTGEGAFDYFESKLDVLSEIEKLYQQKMKLPH